MVVAPALAAMRASSRVKTLARRSKGDAAGPASSAPWEGAGFDVFLYGRPEGMTIEHCVLSAAFDRTPTTCRDLCVQKHPNVQLTDPVGYSFAVATDSACRNRLLHSRPVEGGEFLPRLWRRKRMNHFRLCRRQFADR